MKCNWSLDEEIRCSQMSVPIGGVCDMTKCVSVSLRDAIPSCVQ